MWNEDQIIAETRWSRTYANASRKRLYLESKFLDGNASITLGELMTLWPTWSKTERLDFCNAIQAAPKTIPADCFRFLATDESDYVRPTIALCIAAVFPPDESVPWLESWANNAPAGNRANFLQALAHTSDARARGILQTHFEELRSHPGLMEDASWFNHIAADLVACIQHLLELGVSPEELHPEYTKLLQHPCVNNQDQARRFLAEAF